MPGTLQCVVGLRDVDAVHNALKVAVSIKIKPEFPIEVDGVGNKRRVVRPARRGSAIGLPVNMCRFSLEQRTGLSKRRLAWHEKVQAPGVKCMSGGRTSRRGHNRCSRNGGRQKQPCAKKATALLAHAYPLCEKPYCGCRRSRYPEADMAVTAAILHYCRPKLNILVPWILRKARAAASRADLRSSSCAVAL